MPYLPDGRLYVNVTAPKTLAATDVGVVQNVIGGGTITLPSTAAGLDYTVRNGGSAINASGPVGAVQNATATVTVAPAAADAIAGNNFTAVVNKAAINTAAAGTATASKVGDEIEVVGTGTAGVTAWQISHILGLWTRQP